MTLPTVPQETISREYVRVAGGLDAPAEGLSPAGGLDIDNAGNLATNGDVTVKGVIHAGATPQALTDANGAIDGARLQDGSVNADKLDETDDYIVRSLTVDDGDIDVIDGKVRILLSTALPRPELLVKLAGSVFSENSYGSGTLFAVQSDKFSSGWCNIAIIAGSAAKSRILLGDTDNEQVGRIEYDHSANRLTLFANSASRVEIDAALTRIKTAAIVEGNLTVSGALLPRQVNDSGMSSTAGARGEIVCNLADNTFYGCTTSGNPATWVAFH